MKILRVVFVIAVLCAPFYAQQVNQDIVPASPGLYLGHTNQRWNGYFNNADIYNLTINGSPIGTAGIGLPQISIPNGTNCTTLNGLVEFDGNGQAQTASLSSAKVIGVAVSGAGCSGNVLVQYAAIVNCTTDGSTLINDRIAASNSIPGDCMDIGPISIPGIQTVGLVTAVSSGAGQLTSFDLFTGDTISPSSSSGSGVVSVSPCVGPFGYAATAAAIVSWDCNTSLDGSGNAGFKKVTVTGSGAGKIDFGSSTTPGNPSAGFFRLYADSGTGFLTCLTSTGTSCLSSGTAFSAITGGTNTSAAMRVGNNASLQPLNFGRIISTGSWMYNTDPEPSTGPTWGGANTGGSLVFNQNYGVEFTLNSAAGETSPSGEAAFQLTTHVPACITSNCVITVTAPTLPIGFTGYTVYARNISTAQSLQQIAGCVNVSTNCTFGSIPTTSSPPTTNALVPLPPNALASECPPNVTPIWWIPDTAGNMHSQAYISQFFDNTFGPPSPGGTFVECRRHWFTDNQIDPPGGKNAMIVMDHFSGVGTATTNQDRALWVDEQNPANDAATRYAMEGIQAELDFNCNGCSINGSPDSEVSTLSLQLSDNAATNSFNGAGSGYGMNVIRAQYFKQNAGSPAGGQGYSVLNGVLTINNNTFQSGSTMATIRGNCPGGTGGASPANLSCYGYLWTPASTAAKPANGETFLFAGANNSFTPASNDFLLRSWVYNYQSLMGPILTTGLKGSSDTTPLTVTGDVKVTGSITSLQQPSPVPGNPSCSGGASTYGYKWVMVDANGGQVASATVSTGGTCVNPLTGVNPANFTSAPHPNLASGGLGLFVRADLYRVSGPMGTGKIGCLGATGSGCTWIDPSGVYDPSLGLITSGSIPTIQDTGLVADGTTPPTVNTTGGIAATSYARGALNTKQRAASDFTTSSATLVNLFTWNLPPLATNYSFDCELVYSQQTGLSTLLLGVQSATVAPTSLMASARIDTNTTGAASTFSTGTSTITTTTATTVLTGGTVAANNANYQARIYGTIEAPATAPGIDLSVMVGTGNVADQITILRGSYCQLY